MLSSGGRDSLILHHDIRSQRSLQSTYLGHQQEVCGLSWSPDGTTLASGGNDNTLCLWDAAMSSSQRVGAPWTASSSTRRLSNHSSAPRHRIEAHTAAVKALAWCPWQRNLLASGGGTADRTIRLWNTQSGANVFTMDTGSQVCAMQWSESHRELVSSHGFSDNQLCLWKYSQAESNLTKVKELRGHTSRVLHMAKSPDGTQIVTAGADETLRFWDLFPHSSALCSAGRRSGESKMKLSPFAAAVPQLASSPCLR
jgi:cell division cycle 20, cofactor of APC complex